MDMPTRTIPIVNANVERGGFEYLTSKKDELVGWARKFSLFPYPFVTACCAMEFMAVSSTPYDTDRAKQLLQDAGYPGKFKDPTINIFTVSQVGWEPDFLQVIAGYWQGAGIQTQLVPMDFTAMRNGWVAPDPKMMGGIATWIGIGGGAAGNSMPAQQNNMTSQGVNQSAHDPDLDKMFFDMIAQLDSNKRLDMWHQVQQKAFSLHSIEGICRVFDQYAVSDKVGEWTGLDYLADALIMGLSGVQHR